MLLPAVVAALLLTVPARAEIVSVERLLLPAEVADRIEGSGVVCGSMLAPDGTLYRVDLASLRFRLSSRLSLRGGIGMAAYKLSAVLPEESAGIAISGGVTATVWRDHGYALDLTGGALRASYAERGLSQAALMITFGTQ